MDSSEIHTNENLLIDMPQINYYIGEKIRQKRNELGMSIEVLSNLLGFSSNFLGSVERGQRGISLKSLFKIASFFEFSLDDLTGFSNIAIEQKNNSNEFQNKLSTLLVILKNLDIHDMDFIYSLIIEFKLYRNKKTNMEFMN